MGRGVGSDTERPRSSEQEGGPESLQRKCVCNDPSPPSSFVNH
jgi:hypothetical protein